MTTPAAITTIRTCLRVIFRTHKMFATSATMTTFAKYPDIINEVFF
jgi:hypothetical protein